jgi:hypothetical protein
MLVPGRTPTRAVGRSRRRPDADDQHIDETTDYVYNDVAIDYNAAFVGALAGLWPTSGRTRKLPPGPRRWSRRRPPTTPGSSWSRETRPAPRSPSRSTTGSPHPPALVDDLSARYYFDISEMTANGQSADDIKVEVYYDEAKVVDGTDTKTLPTHPGRRRRVLRRSLLGGHPVLGQNGRSSFG